MPAFLPNILNFLFTSQYYLINKFKAAPCIAVIDESDTAPTATEDVVVAPTTAWPQSRYQSWVTFRTAWPLRPYYLLWPQSSPSATLNIPTNMAADLNTDGLSFGPTVVNRDGGIVENASDWFALANLSSLQPGDSVFLFVDISGSMTLDTVQASYDLFLQNCTNAGIIAYRVSDGNENYIRPFITWSGSRIN